MSETGIQPASGGLSPSPYQELNPVQRVLQNDLLLDKILHFAMMDDDKEEKRKTTNSCKLVQRLWLERVDAAIRRLSQGFKQHLVQFHSKRPSRVKKFVYAFATSPLTLAYRIPSFTLVDDGKLPQSVRNSLLTKCGSGLVKLELVVVNKQWTSHLESLLHPIAPTPLELPNLESITVTIDASFNTSFKLENVTARIKFFVQSILDGCECLQEFSVFTGDKRFLAIFENLTLPPTLTKANFHRRMTPGLMAQLLVDKQLPNLISLTLFVGTSEGIVANELTQVLTHFRHQLQEFYVWVDIFESVSAPKKTIVLPVMDRLQVFKCTAKSIEWSTVDPLSLDNHFPALKTIFLPEITNDSWQKWIQNSSFRLVEEAALSLKLPALGKDNGHLVLLEQMQQIKQAFPNIVDLSLTIPFTKETAHIKFIFQKMRQLHKLHMTVSCCPINMRFDELDRWFLNLNSEVERSTLISQREEWKKLTQGNMPDLRRLDIAFTHSNIGCVGYWRSVLGWNFEQKEDEGNHEESEEENDEDSDEDWEEISDYEGDDGGAGGDVGEVD